MKPGIYFLAVLLSITVTTHAQTVANDKTGKLFIIGGGDRPPALMKEMIRIANLTPTDHIVVLPMSSAEPDSSYYYLVQDVAPYCRNTIANLNFTASTINNQVWLDSLRHAKLIFITGGDQERFMNAVLHTPVYEAIHFAYQNGSTVAGTSAGAAVMSRFMITGRELKGDTTYHATFRKLQDNNIEIKEGLGLLSTAIVDQHFVVRSRYNRLLSALAKFPDLACIGIDEATAIVVHKHHIAVAGEGQVLVFQDPQQLKITENGLIKFKNLQFSIFTAGDEFDLKK
jgi:cyanophycinase